MAVAVPQLQYLVIVNAFELPAFRVKVDKKSDFHVIRFEMIHGLREWNVFQLNVGFEFDHDQFLDEEAG